LSAAFILGAAANQVWQKFQEEDRAVPAELVFAHHLNNPAELDKLQRRGENGQELSFLPNDPFPFSGYAANSYGNGQHELLIQFIKGKTLSAKGWHLNGEPNESIVKNGTGFIMETDDPQVGFFYKDGFEIAYQGKRDNGKSYRECFKDGSHITYHTNGKKKEHSFYVDGKRSDTWQTWNRDGVLIQQIHYKKGKAEGTIREWHDNSKPKEIISVKMGKPDGLWTEYNEDGSLLRVMNYSHGKAEGKWKSFYRTGGIRFEGNFVNDKKQGVCSWWEENGHLKYSKTYAMGTPAY
jgi:antitoxin component YwqK of YwqJK toxin-antitoxin module